jgi:hypothetical protein
MEALAGGTVMIYKRRMKLRRAHRPNRHRG